MKTEILGSLALGKTNECDETASEKVWHVTQVVEKRGSQHEEFIFQEKKNLKMVVRSMGKTSTTHWAYTWGRKQKKNEERKIYV